MLESYRLWRDGDWMAESELIATIKGEFRPTRAVLAGQAFGKVLERPDRYVIDGGYGITVHGPDGPQTFTMDDEVMRPAFALMDYVHGVFEVRAGKVYGDAYVAAVADQVVGDHVIEHKTTAAFDLDKYASSYQWRFYADIFGASRITYHVFIIDDHGNGVLEVRGIESFHLYPYPDLHDDCAALVSEFHDYVKLRGLEGLLRARQAAA